jgi:hypothetical protein
MKNHAAPSASQAKAGRDKTPFRFTQLLGVPASAGPSGRAGDWLQGNADLLLAGLRSPLMSRPA